MRKAGGGRPLNSIVRRGHESAQYHLLVSGHCGVRRLGSMVWASKSLRTVSGLAGVRLCSSVSGRFDLFRKSGQLLGFRDGQAGEAESNWVKIRHRDGTIAAYSHLTEHGVLVKVGDGVIAGQAIGLSGNTGNTGGLPHLHFHLCACSEPVDCGTLPVTFRNTHPNPDGLLARRSYPALSFKSDE